MFNLCLSKLISHFNALDLTSRYKFLSSQIFLAEVYLSISVLVLVNILFPFSAPAPVSLRVINLKLDILCYSSIDSPVGVAISELVIPGLTDQMSVMKKIIASEITQQAQVYYLFNLIIALIEAAHRRAA